MNAAVLSDLLVLVVLETSPVNSEERVLQRIGGIWIMDTTG
jgi:hypothetical protein